MKTSIKNPLIFLLSVCMVSFVFSCKKGDEAGPSQKDLLTNGAWQLESVTLDGEDITDLYEGLSITFNKSGTYSITPEQNPLVSLWFSAGIYALTSNNILITDASIEYTIEKLDENRLVLSFNYTAPSSRVSSVSGFYRFTFTK